MSKGLNIAFVFALASICSPVPPALAAQPETRRPGAQRSLAETLKGQARVAYDAAKLLAEDGDFRAALVKFKSAYELQPDPRLLWNMSACEKELRHYRRVRDLTQEYLERSEQAGLLTTADRNEARVLLKFVASLIGSIEFAVSPPGVVVEVDGEVMGGTPLARAVEADIGQRSITLRKQGYRTVNLSVDVTTGAPTKVELDLEPVGSTLTIQADSASASVFVDGRRVGQGSWTGTVAPGKVMVRVTAPNHRPREMELTLSDGESRRLDLALERERGANAWIWVAGAALVAGAAVGGYFAFRPRELEPLPGTWGDVFLP